MENTVRTRIAPSPTGEDIHIGNLYTALINYTVAKKHDGKFIIRIEDTDRTRYREGAEKKILSSLLSFGLNYDEGPDIGGPFEPYRQSERLQIYKKYAEELVEKGAAYYCFCSKERLLELRERQLKEKKNPRYDKYCLTHVVDAVERIKKGDEYVIRLHVLLGKKIVFDDLIRGEISIDSSEVDDQVLLKSDGYPTYHLGVVVDDHLMEISHIIRAEEWISSTPKHVLLYQALDWKLPIFAHVPILRNPDKSKLSKRKNPVWASWYLEEGFLPEAVLNYLALLGWSHPEEKEIFSLSEFITLFDLKDVNPVGPVFDLVKLRWMNQQYIQKMDDEELLKKLTEFYPYLVDETELLIKLLPLLKTRMETLKDFEVLAGHFFASPGPTTHINDAIVVSEKIPGAVVAATRDMLSGIENANWNKDTVFAALKEVMNEQGIRMPIFYSLFTGRDKGLPLPESLEILGKEKTLERLNPKS